ncbi:hypothetical protein NKOR_07570 [Candidatus Nitrosopumilus koreensis AR1]|uniref:Uncharacterized protein n=1 Tax=Candidatus Nitrosopumilus koreensis AR1 TaxID=1229908 RepID=K0B8U7_9ARCH|nr:MULTISPECIES: hypothetical protein [Nitrosopumilus]AFS81375.1 hypothetical protein NKOR_07570 [Candidatus Nitrosopumilus koreensis AR1]
MTKRIEEELSEMNRLKRLELEFLFFKTRMDETMSQKFRAALTNENIIFENADIDNTQSDSKLESQDEKIRNVSSLKIPIKKVAA